MDFLRCSFAALFYSLSNACVQKLYVVQICPRVPSIRECRVLGALCGGTPISITYSVAVALHHQTPAFRLLREFSTKLSRLCTCDRKRFVLHLIFDLGQHENDVSCLFAYIGRPVRLCRTRMVGWFAGADERECVVRCYSSRTTLELAF